MCVDIIDLFGPIPASSIAIRMQAAACTPSGLGVTMW